MVEKFLANQNLSATLLRWSLLVILFLGGLLLSIRAEAAEWSSYTNELYGFSVDYPADKFDDETVAPEGDGITLTSDNKDVEFRAYGFSNGDELPLEEVRDIILEDSDGRDVTYKRIKDKWIVISGYEQENGQRMIFYQRLQASEDLSSFSAFELIYPESKRDIYDPLIKRMSLSLTAPSG